MLKRHHSIANVLLTIPLIAPTESSDSPCKPPTAVENDIVVYFSPKGAIRANIVDRLRPLDQVLVRDSGDYTLGRIRNLHSLIPYSMEARKPVHKCTAADNLRGRAHRQRGRQWRIV